MQILIYAIVVLIIAGLAIYLADYAPLPAPFANIVKVLVILVAILAIAHRAGVF